MAYSQSALAGEPDTFVLYRIIGNDLPPRHSIGQSRQNVRFILDHEPSFPHCEKRWVVNRISDPEEERAILALLEERGQPYLHIPFVGAEYARLDWDFDQLPQPDFLDTAMFADLTVDARKRALAATYRHKNNYAMNNNGARNAALEDGRTRAKWVLPWDGNCFLTQEAWQQIADNVVARPHLKYFLVPMQRITDNAALLTGNLAVHPTEEPQVLFRRDAEQVFDIDFPYGRRSKVELFWRLGVPGPWERWGNDPWDLARPALSDDANAFGVAGWVARLHSGVSALEQHNREGGRSRRAAREDAIIQMLDTLDQQHAAAGEPSARSKPARKPAKVALEERYTISEQLRAIEEAVALLPPAPVDAAPVAFAISMRSAKASAHWPDAVLRLEQTLNTLLGQSDQNFQVVVAGHERPDLAQLASPRVTWLSIDRPAPTEPAGYTADKLAKRRLIGAHLRATGFSGFLMALDADDWVHYRFVEWLRRSPPHFASFFRAGFTVNYGKGSIWLRSPEAGTGTFYRACGSSSVFRLQNEDFPATADRDATRASGFGVVTASHNTNAEKLEAAGVAVSYINLPMVAWVLGHGNNNTLAKGKMQLEVDYAFSAPFPADLDQVFRYANLS